MKNITAPLSRILLLIAIAAVLIAPHAAADVTIPDPGLEQAIRDGLGLSPADPITEAALAGIIYLSASQYDNITDLTGLEHCTSLQYLYLYSNHISDLTPLQGLTSLKGIELGENQISNLAPLESLIRLESLGLGNNRISDLTPLLRLDKLASLYLYENQISNLEPLYWLTSLREIDLSNNQISDLAPLQGLTSLTHLLLHINCISDLSSLLDLPDLVELYLDLNPLSNAAIEEQIPQLVDNGAGVDFSTYSDANCPVGHPADTNTDWRIGLSEAIAYLAGWQQGGNPMADSIRAAYLWQNGEAYRYDTGQAPPMCWVLGN